MSKRDAMKQVAVRLEENDLNALVELGRAAKPMPLTQSDMIRLAVSEYVQRHVAGEKGKARPKGK